MQRVLARLDELYAIGGGAGANRPGLSAEEERAHELVGAWLEEAGLEVARDGFGNLLGRLRGRRPELPEVWTGSHLDSVPNGGRFDGALGVVAGLEAVLAAGPQERTLGVVAFRDEEGWRFGRGCLGSRAAAGLLGEEDLGASDADGISVADALASLGAGGGERFPLPGLYIEAHIEQGPRLERAGAPLGVVTGIVGTARGEATFAGSAGHAGTTPMAERRDALCAAAEFVLRVREAARAIDGAVATVGQLLVEPGASNVVPARVVATVDARAPDLARLDVLVAAIGADVRTWDPVAMAPEPTRVLREEVARIGVPVVELASGAGHDAGSLAAVGVETGMLFVRSLAGGVSHAPEEHSSAEDVELCVHVVTAALRRLAS